MQPRDLTFVTFHEVMAEVDRLHAKGYDRAGNWDLAQVLDHLCYFMNGALDGFQFKVPWLIKTLFGKMALNATLKSKRMKRGVFTPQKPLPVSGPDEKEAVARFKMTLERFTAHQGEYHPSPFFGKLSREQVHALNLIHCGHHLGFLLPRG
jgi:hypothetical protein